MTRARTLIVSVPRGSGGSYAHLSRVVPRLIRLMPSWQIEVHGSEEVLRSCFGRSDESWTRPLPDSGYRARVRWEFVELPRRLRVDPHAIVWAPFGPPLNVGLASRTVWMSRNLLPLLPRTELELSAPDRVRVAALRVLYSLWARRARRTICVSSHARERLARLARVDDRTITVIPHGVDAGDTRLECSTPELERVREKPYLLHIGQPVPYRRTRELFAAFTLLAQRTPNVPALVVAGKARPSDRGYEEACLQSLAGLESEGRAVLLGQISHADALALMEKAHVFGYPSVHEDCPNVVLEALSAGRVGVYADIPAVRELAADAGLFVRDPEAAKLAEALERALFDGDERARIATAAVGRAALFTWDQTAERTAAVLEQAAT